MNDYCEVRIDISPCNEDGTDYMAALLADVGFESFVPDENGLTAYIKTEDFDVIKLNNALADYPFAAALDVSSKVIEGRDWNAEWEKNYFQPIVIGDMVVVHSTFHKDVPRAKYDIVIDPKMAFGTGHHATTSQVMQALLSSDLKGKSVIDMGTGTGILSILAVLAGAEAATGIEIEAFAFNNACENIQLNNTGDRVKLINGDASALSGLGEADVFVANINRNVITADINQYVRHLKDGGKMILSGFYETDIPVIMEVAEPLGLTEVSHSVLNNWACLILVKKSK